jgi:O-antigen ligase
MRALLAHAAARPVPPAVAWLGVLAVTLALIPFMRRAELFLLVIPAAIAAVWLLANPAWGVLLLFAGWFFRRPEAYPVMAVLALALAVRIYRERRVRVLEDVHVPVLLAIGGLFLLSTTWNEFWGRVPWLPDMDSTRQELTIFAMRVAFITFVFYFIDTPRRAALWAWVVIAFVAVAALSSLRDFGAGQGFRRAHADFGMASNANRLAHLCMFATSLVWFYRAHGPDRRLRRLTLPLLFLLLLTVLYAGSRSGFLQLLVFALLAIVLQEGWSPAQRLRSIAVLGSLVLMLAAVAPTAQLMRATTFDRHRAEQGQDSLKNRLNTVVAAVEVLARDPVLGIGIGNFRSVKRTYYGLPRQEGTHNGYLWAALAGGVGALALYLYLFYRTYRTLRELERSGPRDLLWLARGLRVGLILFVLFSAFTDFWLSEMFPVVIGLPMALSLIAARAGLVPARTDGVALRPAMARGLR